VPQVDYFRMKTPVVKGVGTSKLVRVWNAAGCPDYSELVVANLANSFRVVLDRTRTAWLFG
jgi:hypothetical protein